MVAASCFTNGIVYTPVTRVFWTFSRNRIALRLRPCRARYSGAHHACQINQGVRSSTGCSLKLPSWRMKAAVK